MKKRTIITLIIVVTAILIIPVPMRLKYGGTVRYQAALYGISNVHRLAPTENDVAYEDGIIVEILGIEVFNNVDTHTTEAPVTESVPTAHRQQPRHL